jgi:hypothetical protein
MSLRKQYPKEYAAWNAAKQRCTNRKLRAWHNYGGRGIRFCKRWDSFELFFKDMGPKPSPKHSLDRIDNNKAYKKTNCRWATQSEQANNRYNVIVLTWQGKTQGIKEWAAELGMKEMTLRQRIQNGWSTERALTMSTSRNKKYGSKEENPRAYNANYKDNERFQKNERKRKRAHKAYLLSPEGKTERANHLLWFYYKYVQCSPSRYNRKLMKDHGTFTKADIIAYGEKMEREESERKSAAKQRAERRRQSLAKKD